ncbi:MAG: 3-isopropylmalate dehydratase large subunit (EC [uncultured Campylobacterales bacterium]|uniref:3-isopropylmalate dehydratase large subunit (EC) n=1 Tax=uncultured Campylobacterales bacterium TaxID=352960 RepID=A0A6S6SWM0_9BACT|nr:MAG: 3-isopropylmalate dehydratase large subunit (EC [uncultured Campylobacterales bacterium]
MTLVEQIVSHNIGRSVKAGDLVERLPITKMFMNEVIAPPALAYFQNDFGNTLKNVDPAKQVYDPSRIFLIPDHTVPSSSAKVSEGMDMMREFAGKTGIKMFKEGDGVEHILMAESGHIVAGDIVIGTDSHTDTNGAINALSFGAGTTDAQLAMATGFMYNFTVPKSIYFNLTGKLGLGVSGKDVILYIIGMLGAQGCSKMVAEFGGKGIASLNMDDRFSMANMCVEMSARTGIFEYDDEIDKYINATGTQWDSFKSNFENDLSSYEKVIDIDLSAIEPMVAFPHLPANVIGISKLDEMIERSQRESSHSFASVTDAIVNNAYIGSCTNGRLSDLAIGARIVNDRQVHPDVNLIVIPGSRKIYNQILENGDFAKYAKAGANLESSNCGPCFGKHMGVLSNKGKMISSSNRNYKGRMGHGSSLVFLASPATVAASAIEGKITDPRKYLK